MFKVGDEVLVKAKIKEVATDDERLVRLEGMGAYWFIPTDKTYSDGLNDAWELAKRFAYGDLSSPDKRRDVFGSTRLPACMNPKDGVEEVIFTVESYDKKKSEFKVGDEVKNVVTGNTFWVIAIEGKHMDCYSSSVEQNIYPVQHFFENFDFLKKTGRTTDAIDLLKQIGE